MHKRQIAWGTAFFIGVSGFSSIFFFGSTERGGSLLGAGGAVSDHGITVLAPENDPVVMTREAESQFLIKNQNNRKKKTTEEPRGLGNIYFDEFEVFDILQRVNLNDDGSLVIDSQLHDVFESLFESSGFDLERSSVETLLQMIERGVPGEAGGQAAFLASNFFELRSAEIALGVDRLYSKNKHNSNDYQQRIELRRAYLGEEVAGRMYGEEEALVKYFDSASHVLLKVKNSGKERDVESADSKQLKSLEDELDNALVDLQLHDGSF